MVEVALARVALDDDPLRTKRLLAHIEPQLGFLLFRTVALETRALKKRIDFVFEIDGPAAPHELTIRAVSAPVALGKLFAVPPVKASTAACEANWLKLTLPDVSVAFTASRYWPCASDVEFHVAVHLPIGSAAAVPAAAFVQALPLSLATPSALVSA